MSYEKNPTGYQHTRVCEACNRFRWCKWRVTDQFQGMWTCAMCDKHDDDALADVVKAAQRRLEGDSK